MIKHKSTLAKLLAKENIHVQYGNYQTAWFDIKNRILGIPMWKDLGRDVSDLFIGHEVGHALFTPYEGWHDSPEKLEGCPRTYINVLEDARIERKIKDAYPGLVGPMARGYTKLFNQGFFGEDFIYIDWDEVKLIDKLNLKAKVGSHLNIPMNDKEKVFYDRSMNTNTFDEVLQLVRDVLAYTKEFQEELLTPPPAPTPEDMGAGDDKQEMDGPGPSGHDDFEGEQQDSQENPESTPDLEGDDEKPGQDTPTKSDENTYDDEEEEKLDQGNPKQDEDMSISDDNFRRSEHKLLEADANGTQPLVGNEFSKEVRKELVTPYKVLAAERKERMEANMMSLEDTSHYSDKSKPLSEINEDYPKYLKEVKKNVNFAVKEFEMRKAGYRYTRAATAKTGSIDVNRLWSYKTNDDIFARVTKLADAKNHGMMMFIDFSGSMNDTIPEVMDQLFHLAVFCKAVNIPFDVYGFTNTNTNLNNWKYDRDPNLITVESKESELHHGGLSLPQLITSTLKKKDYDEALKHIYLRAQLAKDSYSYRERYIMSPNEDYGSTPLNQTLIAAHRMVDSFKRANNIDNMNLVVISDGDTNRLDIVKNPKREYADVNRYGKTYINIMNKNVELESDGRDGTASLLKSLQRKFGVTTIGFFIADSSHNFKRKIYDCDRDAYWDDEVKKYNREYSKNKCVRFVDALGYSEFYIVKSGKQLATESVEFAPVEEASKGQITTAFKKFSKSKKVNKTLLTNFGKVVAE